MGRRPLSGKRLIGEIDMSIFGRLFGSKAQPSTEPPRTVKELLAARAPPWNRVAQTVINSVLEAITDKGLLEAFVRLSMNVGLVPRYEALGGEDADPRVIRAQISQILCETGNRALPPLGESIAAGRREAAIKALTLADDAF